MATIVGDNNNEFEGTLDRDRIFGRAGKDQFFGDITEFSTFGGESKLFANDYLSGGSRDDSLFDEARALFVEEFGKDLIRDFIAGKGAPGRTGTTILGTDSSNLGMVLDFGPNAKITLRNVNKKNPHFDDFVAIV